MTDPAVVRGKVQTVAAWYSQEIGAERGKAEPDGGRIEELLEKQRLTAAKVRSLPMLSKRELTAIDKEYTALLAELAVGG